MTYVKNQTGDDLERLHRELPRVLGQAHKVKRFHPHKGELLVEKFKSAEQQIKNIAFSTTSTSPEEKILFNIFAPPLRYQQID